MRLVLLLTLLMTGCASTHPVSRSTEEPAMRIAHLGREGGDADGFEGIRRAFVARNPGYDVEWVPGVESHEAGESPCILFVQRGEGAGTVISPDGEKAWSSAATVGDIILLRPGERLRADGKVDALAFTSPVELPGDLPAWIRPDWNPRITDTPGGCATETGAYRRILLTWLHEKGPYVYHALNAHRVRITDSFSHYHPVEGGFDEFYLVQMVQPGGHVVTSPRVPLIERPDEVDGETAASLLQATEVEVGDLIYMPRGLLHRGVGGVLAQVITVPGFKPGAEIGCDHHLRAINERLGLEGEAALPYNVEASSGPVIR